MKIMTCQSNFGCTAPRASRALPLLPLLLLAAALATLIGCGSSGAKKKSGDFFTSGNQEADQRASQRMAKAEQLSGSGEGGGESGVKKAEPDKAAGGKAAAGKTNTAAQVQGKLALFDRLGGEAGLSNIVADFVPRAMQDPRVNWSRQGIKRGGWFHRAPSVSWNRTPENVSHLKTHLIQFLALATGGPAHYEGKEIKAVHAGMQISNPEFDATVGDLKASLDKLKIPNTEQKELLAIVESTRPEIVTER